MATDPRHLLMLLTWMSPAFPVGGFAYSHGLETAIASGDIQSADDLAQWIAELLSRGSAWNDTVIFARSFEDDPEDLNDLALALCSSHERRLESTHLGKAFAAAASIFLALPTTLVGEWDEVSYPVAAGVACREMGIGKSEALLAYLQGFTATLVSVAVRLVPLGQTAGLAVLRDLMSHVVETAKRAERASLDDLGSITLLADIAAMRHETLEPRVFRT